MIAITNQQRAQKINLRLLERIAAAALEELGITETDLGIVIVSAEEMARLNEEFLNHKGPTDVITFDYKNPELLIPGEIFVCIEEAKRQAKEFKTTWQSEVVRYVVHGILHLSGYDDLQPAARKKMKLVEGRLVRELSRRFALSKL
ncbi:MAG TPA: rRNA maturation RNase YbeY [Candidatus Acidoferrales bacterium]|jgi:probable rRNA maturation factor|nr:rRNA maturation RNase YbeY [Candidatus Acidoferrales bacterium]